MQGDWDRLSAIELRAGMAVLQSACRGRSPRHRPLRSWGTLSRPDCDGCAMMPMRFGLFLPIFGELADPRL
jgi:hypothetical protein